MLAQCPHCQGKIRVSEADVGADLGCPHCDADFRLQRRHLTARRKGVDRAEGTNEETTETRGKDPARRAFYDDLERKIDANEDWDDYNRHARFTESARPLLYVSIGGLVLVFVGLPLGIAFAKLWRSWSGFYFPPLGVIALVVGAITTLIVETLLRRPRRRRPRR
jgi:hypothetical protein